MRCDPCREAVSARLDGEDPGVPDDLVDRHLAGCAPCRSFAATGAHGRRHLAVRPADPVPDLTASILARAAAPAGDGAHWTRWALLIVALTQLAIALPPMLLGRDADTTVHVARELGAWDLALAAALLLVVVRPSRAVGLLPFAAALAVALAAGAVVDVASGRAGLAAEAQHLLELAGLALLWATARRPADPTPLLGGLRRARPGLVA
ncbi:MAG TPA: zf-HC2 domain-containing protein [Aquihabitans sp.]|jgi:predicted anti-sigma-YlaC factor YlaD|nr:zf-HC2 domain-containing protein [Aquihabitans sp.]